MGYTSNGRLHFQGNLVEISFNVINDVWTSISTEIVVVIERLNLKAKFRKLSIFWYKNKLATKYEQNKDREHGGFINT